MPSYLVLRSPSTSVKFHIAEKFLEQGHIRLHRGLWMTYGKFSGLEDEPTVDGGFLILKPSRALRKAFVDEEKDVYELGSLILIAYELFGNLRLRKIVSRLVKKSPCFKLTPSIYLFPQVKYDDRNWHLVKPSTLMKSIIVLGGRVTCVPRLTLHSTSSAKLLVEELRESLRKRVDAVQTRISKVYEQSNPTKTLSELRKEAKILEELLDFYKKKMGLDFKDVYERNRKAIRTLKKASVNSIKRGLRETHS